MLLKVTNELFAVYKTTPNEPSPVCQPFFCLCLLGMPSVLQAASGLIVTSVALPLKPELEDALRCLRLVVTDFRRLGVCKSREVPTPD